MRLPLTPPFEQIAERLAARPPRQSQVSGGVRAAVALLLAPDPDSLLFIRRATRAGDPWSGHIGLPGGRHDPADPDLLTTAIRETGEEVGVHLDRSALLGVLDDVTPKTPVAPPLIVRPFVFALPSRPLLQPGPEVAAPYWIPLARLLAPGCLSTTTITIRKELRLVPAYLIDDLVVWGMTERILSSFFKVVL